MTTLAAFDLALTSTGVADDCGPRLIAPKSTGPERLIEIRQAVLRACHTIKPYWDEWCCSVEVGCVQVDLVAIEGYAYGRPNQAHQLGELGGVVRVALHEAGIPVVVVPPASVKTYATGKGNASKDDVLLAAVRRLDYAGSTKDESDALWLYALVMDALGQPVVTVPAIHRRAVSTVTLPVGMARRSPRVGPALGEVSGADVGSRS